MPFAIGMRHPLDYRFWRWPAHDMSLALIVCAVLAGCAATKSEQPAAPPHVSDCIDCGASPDVGKRFAELRRKIDELREELKFHQRRLKEYEGTTAQIFQKIFDRLTEQATRPTPRPTPTPFTVID